MSSHSPLTPAPVPISRIECTVLAAASTASCAPTAGETGSTPSSSECARACEMAGDSSTKSSAYRQLRSLLDTCPPSSLTTMAPPRERPGRRAYADPVSFGLTFDKLLIIAIIAVFLIGPDRLPGYAAQLARLVKSLRGMADGAKERMREEMGPEFDEVDWKKLDPRQYDPRRIIREALVDEVAPRRRSPSRPRSRTSSRPTTSGSASSARRARRPSTPRPPSQPLAR